MFHFAPSKGWMNDPNGLIKIGDTYHIFYQHYPEDIVWGPMHWGHATSRDMVSFEEKSIALYPTEEEYIFSGSCVLDEENVSGFGRGALLAFYTAHNPKTGEQQQSLAYSLDYEHFTKYEGNPIIKNSKNSPDYRVDFRDPKVFRNPIKGGYSMVLSGGRTICFYHSLDLLNWEKTGEFDPSVHGFGGICECPDCFFLPVESIYDAWDKPSVVAKKRQRDRAEDGISGEGERNRGNVKETKDGNEEIKNEQDGRWVLVISSILDESMVGKPLEEHGYAYSHVMQYFVGEFDGETFRDTEVASCPLVLDYGPDNYAAVTFFGSEKPLMYGWGENWNYVRETPADIRRGKLTVARNLKLYETESGLRLAQIPVEISEAIRDKKEASETVTEKEYLLAAGASLELKNSKGGSLIVSLEQDALTVDRRCAMPKADIPALAEDCYQIFTAKRVLSGSSEIHVLQDGDYFEIFADEGLICVSVMTF